MVINHLLNGMILQVMIGLMIPFETWWSLNLFRHWNPRKDNNFTVTTWEFYVNQNGISSEKFKNDEWI